LKLGLLENELANAISEMTEKEAKLEMVGLIKEEMLILEKQLREAENNIQRSQKTTDVAIQSQSLSNAEIKGLQDEIDQLNFKLTQAKEESKAGVSNEDLLRLQEQLQIAVAESVEMQAELEATRARLSQMEANGPYIEQQPQLQKLLSDAQDAESQAESRIEKLTQSLRNSEGLRKQMEELISEIQNNDEIKAKDYSEDPRFLEMQTELMLLQEDLLAVRNIDNPKIESLQNELTLSQNDSARLNEEFKGAMADFVEIKEQMALLENENDRLENEILGNSNNQNKYMVTNLQSQLSEVQGEFANLREQLAEKDKRLSNLREELAQAQLTVPGISPDNASLRSKVVRLEGMLESAQDGESRSQAKADSSFRKAQALSQEVTMLKDQLRQAESALRGLPSRIEPLVRSRQIITPTINDDQIEIARLKKQVQQLKLAQTIPQRDQFDRKIRDLNQKNLTAQIQLDQERARVEDYKRQLADALEIKQGVLERGQSANLKVSLLNEELEGAKNRISSLERTLIAARDAIRVLKKNPNSPSMQVSVPRSPRFNPTSSLSSNRSVVPFTASSPRQFSSRSGTPPRTSGNRNSLIPQSSFSSPGIQQIPKGNASLQLRAQVQFLNNKNRPAGFTEFFLLRDDLESIIKTAGIRIPSGQGIDSGSELWARSVQRGYRYPGVASAIRNALATKSLARIKTNSIGESNLEDIEPGNYFVVGSSPLGQVGVVWSKEIQLKPGTNGLTLDLRDAVWAE
jgi:chromosome segregation ATPase